MDDPFPYEYVGGGYFRRKGVPVGKKGDSLHGQEAVNHVLKQLEAARKEVAELKATVNPLRGCDPNLGG